MSAGSSGRAMHGGSGGSRADPGYGNGIVREASVNAAMRRLRLRCAGSTEVGARYSISSGDVWGPGVGAVAAAVSDSTVGKCVLRS
jgi:hypothetical protein